MMICGASNIDTPKSNMLGGNYLGLFEGNRYMIMNKNATGVTNQSSTYIDQKLLSVNESCEFSLKQDCLSDLYPLSL